MPNFRTVQDGLNYCLTHFPGNTVPQPKLAPTYSNYWHISHMTELKWLGIVILALVAYGAGRWGFSTLWTDIKNIYATIRNYFSGKTSSTTPTPTPVATTPGLVSTL